jgi:perosamine synthetase
MINWSSFKVVGRELECLVDAFNSGWVSGGPYVEKLESELESIFSGSTALAVSNGTSALQLAFQTLDLRPGDHVVVPSFCFQAAANVLRQLGAVPVFCDVDPLNWNQTAQTISMARTSRTVGVVVVHNYGAAAPVEQISRWTREQGLWLIEDCAEAWFTQHAERYVGQFGDISTFSMHATKTISCGEGGAILINDSKLVPKARLLRSHGLDRTRVQYLHECAGNNFRLSNLLAAVSYAQLEKRDSIIHNQFENAKLYISHLQDHWAVNIQSSLTQSVDYFWAVAVNIWFDGLTIDRDKLIYLLREHGVETRPGFYPASCLSYNNDTSLIHSDVADRLHKNVIVLPCSMTLDADQIKFICDTLLDLIQQHRNAKEYNIVEALEFPMATSRIEKFYRNLNEGAKGFRYFDKRKFDVIQTHLSTPLLVVDGEIVGYGHLDPDGDDVWLGICLSDGVVGQGWGKVLMGELLRTASKIDIRSIVLQVNRDNETAIRLYRSFGFKAVPGDRTLPSITMKLER